MRSSSRSNQTVSQISSASPAQTSAVAAGIHAIDAGQAISSAGVAG